MCILSGKQIILIMTALEQKTVRVLNAICVLTALSNGWAHEPQECYISFVKK